MRRALLILPLALAASGTFGRWPRSQVPARTQPMDTPCRANGAVLRPSRDLYCIELTPIPALEGASGSFELNRSPSPFGSNVTRDGLQVYAPVLRASGLPEPAAFSTGARVWIAWMATQQLYPTRKLGVVGNGAYALPAIDWPKFLILITAEASAEVAEPLGRVALRGFSPSSRMQPPDMSQFLYGAVPVADSVVPNTAAAAGHSHPSDRPPASGITQSTRSSAAWKRASAPIWSSCVAT